MRSTTFEPEGVGAGDAGPESVRRGAVGTAVLAPGSGYPPQAPLLFFTGLALLQHGWRVEHHWWDPPSYDDDQMTAWVCAEISGALPADGRALVVGKSLGTRAARLAAERGLPAVWLTPLLGLPALVEAIAANPAPQLLVGGTADPFWDRSVARDLESDRCAVLEVPDTDHILMTPGDVVAGVEAHVDVVRAVDRWLTELTLD